MQLFFGVEDNDFLVTVMSKFSAAFFHSAMYRINKLTYFLVQIRLKYFCGAFLHN